MGTVYKLVQLTNVCVRLPAASCGQPHVGRNRWTQHIAELSCVNIRCNAHMICSKDYVPRKQTSLSCFNYTCNMEKDLKIISIRQPGEETAEWEHRRKSGLGLLLPKLSCLPPVYSRKGKNGHLIVVHESASSRMLRQTLTAA
jgi:hypothetical protein